MALLPAGAASEVAASGFDWPASVSLATGAASTGASDAAGTRLRRRRVVFDTCRLGALRPADARAMHVPAGGSATAAGS